MKITICSSMKLALEILELQTRLEKRGHICLIPFETELWTQGGVPDAHDPVRRKIKHDLIRKHFEKIQESDAILVLNLSQNGVPHYIGANTFLEMGFAHVLGLRIFLMHQLPDNPYIKGEAEAMRPIVLYGNLSHIT